MQKHPSARFGIRALLALLVAVNARTATAQALQPIVYTVTVPAPETHVVHVDAAIPTGRRATVELMMPVWSPGFYRVEHYASHVQALSARALDGTALSVERPQENHWLVHTGARPTIIVSYQLLCDQRSVTTNWVSPDLGVLNGAPTFITLAEQAQRPHDVRLELPPVWPRAMTGLAPAPDSQPNHYRAGDYDTLVDSPIVAGHLSVHEFKVDGTTYELVDAGDADGWDGARAAADLAKVVHEDHQLWGFTPFTRYVFLNVFRPGGGGLEHKNSTLLTANAASATTAAGYHRWLSFVSHEYFHAYNVKRLRPVALGPFDYEHPPHTPSLWISEGLTDYYANLTLARAGLSTQAEYLSALSSQIRQLQNEPGRLAQTLAQSSDQVWTNSLSGVNPDASTVSYYIKGYVVGILLDAKIRHATAGARSLDDVMRLAYQRYAGAHGFTPARFRATVSDVAGADLSDWYHDAVATTDELDYSEMLNWFGLRFARADDPTQRWTLEVRPEASPAQQRHLRALLAPDRGH